MGRRGASWAQLEASWPQLGPNLSPTKVQHGATWACLDASWGLYAQLGPVWRHLARKLCPMSPSKPKNVGNSGKNASFQRVTLSPQNCPGWARLPQKGCQLGQVALSWTQLEPKLAPSGHVGLKLGAKRSTWFPNWSRVMHMEAEVTSKVAQLGHCGNSFTPTWAQRRHNMRNIASNEASSIANKHVKFQWKRALWGCRIGPAMSSMLKRYGPQLEPKLLPHGSDLGPSCSMLEVGLKLEPSGSKLGIYEAIFGQRWPQMEPMMLLPCQIDRTHSDDVAPICQMRKLPQQGNDFWRPVPGEHAPPPPSEAVPVWQICPYHSLLNYHASTPSARADFISEWLHAPMFVHAWYFNHELSMISVSMYPSNLAILIGENDEKHHEILGYPVF